MFNSYPQNQEYPSDILVIYQWLWSYPLVNLHNHGKSLFLMVKSTISMAIFNSYLFVYQRVRLYPHAPIMAIMAIPGTSVCWRRQSTSARIHGGTGAVPPSFRNRSGGSGAQAGQTSSAWPGWSRLGWKRRKSPETSRNYIHIYICDIYNYIHK
jgi:hypothetical protein